MLQKLKSLNQTVVHFYRHDVLYYTLWGRGSQSTFHIILIQVQIEVILLLLEMVHLVI